MIVLMSLTFSEVSFHAMIIMSVIDRLHFMLLFQENVRLSSLDLSWNGFCEDGGLALADALVFNTNLKELDISSNRLTLAVATRLAKALSTNEVLEVLKVGSIYDDRTR